MDKIKRKKEEKAGKTISSRKREAREVSQKMILIEEKLIKSSFAVWKPRLCLLCAVFRELRAFAVK